MRIVSPWKILRYGYNLIIKKDTHTMNHFRWMRDNAEDLNFLFELDKNSIVLDLGGYKGNWANEIYRRYGCNIFIFEPVSIFYKNIKKRFETIDKIRVYNIGISDSDKITNISINNDSSSTHKISQESLVETIKLKDIVNVINENKLSKIDLIKINIEGGEYEVLPKLIKSEKIRVCKNILVQFHPFGKNYQEKYESIRNKLRNTHHLTFEYPLVWENWKIND
ncbi:MAG: FkbM family methyltransferase [Thaumarchaeota archaeon]|nr:FkbM family methyltransferase [Nitrososphaerota archaeon]